jgi:hypothetical protein
MIGQTLALDRKRGRFERLAASKTRNRRSVIFWQRQTDRSRFIRWTAPLNNVRQKNHPARRPHRIGACPWRTSSPLLPNLIFNTDNDQFAVKPQGLKLAVDTKNCVSVSFFGMHFERDPIPYALETDWPVEAAGFEPLHLMRTCTKTLRLGGRIRTSASQNSNSPESRLELARPDAGRVNCPDSDAKVRILPPIGEFRF